MKSDPHITYRRKPASLDLVSLESFAQLLRRHVAKGREFHVLITNDRELQSLNAQFRRKHVPTDVLSFPASSPDSTPGRIGDIAISLNRARAQAREWGHTAEDELRILMLHGVLHLLGMDHDAPSDNGIMQRAEMRWRKKLKLPAALIERAA